jgi:MFS family permease
MSTVLKLQFSRQAPKLRPEISRIRWGQIAPTLFVATVIAQIDKISIAVVIANASFLREMGLIGHPALIGGLVTAFLMSYGVGLFIWGFLIDWMGPKRAAVIGVCLWSVMLLWGGLSTSLDELFASRIGLGLAEGVLYPVCNAYAARWYPWSERGRAQSSWFNGATVGAAFGAAVATSIILTAGWRALFFVLAIAGLVIVVPMFLWMTSDLPDDDLRVSTTELNDIHAQEARPPAKKISGVLVDYRYWLLILSFTCNNIFFWGWQSWMPTYLMSARHFSFRGAGWVTVLMFTLEIIAVFAMGMVTDRAGRRAWWGAAGFCGAALGLLVGGYIPVLGLSIAVLIAGLCCQQASAGNAQALVHSFSEQGSMGRAAGIFNGIANLAAAFSPVLVGTLIGLNSSFDGVLWFLTIVLLVAGAATAGLAPKGY